MVSNGQSSTSTTATLFINGCLDNWEQGGKIQVHEALRHGLVLLSQSSEADGFSLAALLHALLCKHSIEPRLLPSAFSELFVDLTEANQIASEEPKASSSRDPSPASSSTSEYASSSPYANVLLDVIWAVDMEIDSRNEVAVASSNDSLGQYVQGTLDEQAKIAKTRLAKIVCELLHKGILSREFVSQRLDGPLLARIGLLDDEVGFGRKGIRLNTSTYYKQQKFNLLREENEGYSGLINELVSGMGPPIRAVRSTENGDRLVEQESSDERNSRARRVMNNVSALIGYFDLDPNRVLDVILDVFSSNVVRHWPFFLALLSASPWGKGKGKASAWQSAATLTMDVDSPSHDTTFGFANVNIEQEKGHIVIAHILGFKFGYYQQGDVADKVPEDLYLMSAILIREGHIRLADLYTHLSPDEMGMAALHDKYKQSMSDKVMSAKGNALSMAAPLTEDGAGLGGDSGANGSKENGEGRSGDARHDASNQILGLLKALLGIGYLKGSLFILARYPWLCGAYPSVSDLYSRLLSVIVAPAYSSISINTVNPVASNPSLSVSKLRYDIKKQELVKVSLPTPRITSLAPEPAQTLTSSFVYFYGPWKKELPSCDVSQLLSGFVPLLRILGPHLYRNMILFQQICRLIKVAIGSPSADLTAWLEAVRNIILPALTMTSGNSSLVSEVWVILRQLSYTDRYNLYGEWKYSLYRRPELRARQAETEKEAKGILKRISSDNLKQSGRSLAKSSHTNPTIFFTVALNQVQSYSNLIAPIVESAKYLTRFEYDVFGFNLIDALSNPEKERTKQDGTSVSMWLQSLAAFTGTLYKRYPMMDCTPVLQYIANQLRQNNSKDLVIVRELILKMAGIEPLANLSDAQVAALTGGRRLRMEAMMVANASVTTPARVQLRKSGARLLQALTESLLAIPLLLLIAQQRQACVYLVESGEAHLKYLGNVFDTCQEVLFQYVEFLQNHLEPQDYSDLMPSLDDMCSRFAIEPAIAFHIARPRLVLYLRTIAAKENEERLRKEVLASKMQGTAKDRLSSVDDEKKVEAEIKDAAEQSEIDGEPKDIEMVFEKEAQESSTILDAEQGAIETIWKTGLQEAVKAAENILTDEAKKMIGVQFYATFWQLSLADIAVPTERYEQEMRSLQQVIDQNPEGGRKSIHKIRIQAQEMQSQLRTELKEQTLAHAATRRRLQSEKDHWFGHHHTRSRIVVELMQHCIVPRALLSPTDAIFAGRFLRSMHTAGTHNFSSLTAYDKIIMEQLAALLFSCTENEVRNYARFLQIVLADLNIWYKDEDRYIKEAYGDNLPGFQMKWGDRQGGEAIPRGDLLAYASFRNVMVKWHNMLRSTFRECLLSKEYMRIRNTIVIMTRIASQFPLLETHGIELLDSIKIMTQDEERGDLKILGQGLLATLKKQQKTWIKKKSATSTPAPSSDAAVLLPTSEATTLPDREKKEPVPISLALPEESSIVEKKEKAHSQEIRKATPPPLEEVSKTDAAISKSSGSAPSPSVLAARKLALESMNNTNMNPPKTVATTASAQASRDRQFNSQRDRETSTSAGRVRERETDSSRSMTSPRSGGRSRETSPGAIASNTSTKSNVLTNENDSRRASRAGSRTGSRAGSEETTSRSSRSDRDREREKERDRDRERDKDRSLSSRRDRGSGGGDRPQSKDDRTVVRDRDSDRDRERNNRREQDSKSATHRVDRALESRSSSYSSSKYDDRAREEDRRKSVEKKGKEDHRPLPTGPRSSMQDSRGSNEYNRRESKDSAVTGSPSSQKNHSSQQAPIESAANRPPRELFSKIDQDSLKEDNGGSKSPASLAKKRSLADRLSASESKSSNGAVSADSSSGNAQSKEEEPNKRQRINRNRFAEDAVTTDRDDQRAPETRSESAKPGISIQGQAKSGQPAFQRKESRNSINNGTAQGTITGRGVVEQQQQHHRYDQDRSTSSSHYNGGGGGGGGGGDRDQRRKDRRSGRQ